MFTKFNWRSVGSLRITDIRIGYLNRPSLRWRRVCATKRNSSERFWRKTGRDFPLHKHAMWRGGCVAQWYRLDCARACKQSWGQIHQHFTSSFFANILLQKAIKSQSVRWWKAHQNTFITKSLFCLHFTSSFFIQQYFHTFSTYFSIPTFCDCVFLTRKLILKNAHNMLFKFSPKFNFTNIL